MKMTNEQSKNIKFVEMVKQNPCLYDYDDINYCRMDIKERIWQEIADKLGDSPHTCKDRWKNIRTVFVRHRSSLNINKKRYYLEKEMQFLIPFLKSTKKQRETGDGLINDDESMSDINFEDKIDQINFEVDLEPNNKPLNLIRYSSPELSQSEDEEIKSRVETKKRKLDVSCNRHRNSSTKNIQIDENKDADKLFLLSCLPDIKLMNLKQKRQLKRGILELIDGILDESNAEENVTVVLKTEPVESSL